MVSFLLANDNWYGLLNEGTRSVNLEAIEGYTSICPKENCWPPENRNPHPCNRSRGSYVSKECLHVCCSIGADRHVIELHLVGCDRCVRQVGFLVRDSGAERPRCPQSCWGEQSG